MSRIAFALCALLGWSAAAEERVKVMVLNLTASEPSLQQLADSLSESVLTEMGRSQRLSVIGQSDVASMIGIERQKQLLGCGENSCFAELSGAMGTPWLVTGSVARLGKAYRLDLKLLRANTGEAAWRDGKSTRDDSEVFEVLASMVNELVRTLDQGAPRRAAGPPIGPLVLIATGAAATIVGGIFTGLAGSQWGSLQDPAWRRANSWVDVEQTATAFNRNIILGPILLGTGLAAAGAGLAWWLMGRTSSVAVVPLPGALALVGSW